MFEESTAIIMANNSIEKIGDIKCNSYVRCEDGSDSRVTSVAKATQTVYEIVQRTKHRANEGEPGRSDPLRKKVFQRIQLKCTAAHELNLMVPIKATIENSFKRQKYSVRWTQFEKFQTLDGRVIMIPKNHHKDFPMDSDGEKAAKLMKDDLNLLYGNRFIFNLQLRDLDYLDGQTRAAVSLRYCPILTGNGILSEFLTGQPHLITSATLSMAWLLGLWLGDGTTKEPEITVDSFDQTLMESLKEQGYLWGLYPYYKDEAVPLRAKHVRLYYGAGPSNKRKVRNLRRDNPFWNTVKGLKFKREDDGHKQLPEFMWNEDVEIREAFLAGLIDADGYVLKEKRADKTYVVTIQTIYHSIMEGVVNIARSLGMWATVTTRSARTSTIIGRQVTCQFTYDISISGTTPLQSVLAYCRSGHKRREAPKHVSREPIYFKFTEKVIGQSNVVGLTIENHKQNILLANKVAARVCTEICDKDQPKISITKNLKHCIACPRTGVRYFYRDWTGNHRVCARCYCRYKFSGYRCLNCKYIPEAREVKKAKIKGEKLGNTNNGELVRGLDCNRCGGILTFDEIRGTRHHRVNTLN
ncbi:Hop NDAI_0H03890 [Naumovozyma dairenensis CBS 421]|uniref:DOD-type homing endonuclease domain-containing protein n=1 Tax=Naumovozyma dairenensis (strain ATCC 10597 / BCRC 20456 / CBS 421 / NBRC 0211 / NRRL Y-12639) TaxID=1071378 RepID=G0WFK1_NAUDC|nr:hypothetical protein NDAI_0H03890 [Naumovozyma dairenensis CBS 421]CCD26562.1 hypothetical protein NDAI_0H03890 [Naumovozyma dairenensis CBS 421]